jgi:hypothetical protein
MRSRSFENSTSRSKKLASTQAVVGLCGKLVSTMRGRGQVRS